MLAIAPSANPALGTAPSPCARLHAVPKIRSIQLLRTPNPKTLVHRSAAAPSTRPNLNRPVAAARAGPVDHRMRVVGPRHPLRSFASL